MGKCTTIGFMGSGVVLAGLAYFLYTPLPDHLANKWQLQKLDARVKLSFLFGELQYQLGIHDRVTGLRNAFEYVLRVPVTDDDKAKLEIFDTTLNGVQVRVYKPKAVKGHMPGLVYYHGGGWIVLSVAAYDGVCAHIAKTANIIVISVEYRLAPEFPFPAGYDDCVQVALYALQHGEDIGLDTNRIAVGGDSAGANLAAVVALKLRDDKVKPALKSQLLIYGCFQFCETSLPIWKKREPYVSDAVQMFSFFFGTYFNMTESQKDILKSNKFLTPEMQKKCDRYVDYKLIPKNLVPEDHTSSDRTATSISDDVKYINSLMDDPRIAPLMVENLENLPPALVMAVEWDSLRDENFMFAERLKMAGNKVKVVFYPDSFHGVLNAFDYDRFGFDAGPKAMKEFVLFIENELK